MRSSVRSVLASLGIVAVIAGFGPLRVVAQEPQAKPRELRVMT
jgi:hypothetical protein